jgi:hypothetical protein
MKIKKEEGADQKDQRTKKEILKKKKNKEIN